MYLCVVRCSGVYILCSAIWNVCFPKGQEIRVVTVKSSTIAGALKFHVMARVKLNIESICSPRCSLHCCMSSPYSHMVYTSCPAVPESHGREPASFDSARMRNNRDAVPVGLAHSCTVHMARWAKIGNLQSSHTTAPT